MRRLIGSIDVRFQGREVKNLGFLSAGMLRSVFFLHTGQNGSKDAALFCAEEPLLNQIFDNVKTLQAGYSMFESENLESQAEMW